MSLLRARVRKGRLVLDEPTELPEGTEVDLLSLDDAELDDDERARLLAALDAAEGDFERGAHVDGFELIAMLRAKREAANR